MSAVIVFDADNTLWDTNAVFKKAQSNLLRVFAEAGLLNNPQDELGTLRKIDATLIKRTGQFEYDFALLAIAIGHYYSGVTDVDASVSLTLKAHHSVSEDLIEASRAVFMRTLEEVPPLFCETENVLRILKNNRSSQQPIVLIMFTDGDRLRIQRILDSYEPVKAAFDEVVIRKKTVQYFKQVRVLGLSKLKSFRNSASRIFMIGDSLKRDIGPSKRAGFITIYRPADFLGAESPSNADESPDFRIDCLSELPDLLRLNGVVLSMDPRKQVSKRTATSAS